MAISDRRYDNNSIFNVDGKLSDELRSSLSSILEKNEEKLRRLKDVKELIDCYKKTREYKQQVEEDGILSVMANKMTEELLKQVEPYYKGSIIRNIGVQTQIRKEQSTVEVSSKIDFDASLKPYVKFIVEINGKESYLLKFTFQIDTSAHITKLKFTNNEDQGKSIHIEKLGIKIELSLIQIEFSDLIISRSHISLNKKIKLGSKSFEIHDLSLYSKRTFTNQESSVCPKCDSLNSSVSKYCTYCSFKF